MGFLDKAKKLADQAQSKIDEVQKDFNSNQSSSGAGASGPAPVEYDQHGRPIRSDAPSAPVTAAAPGVPDAPADKSPRLDPNEPTSPSGEPNRPHGDPLLDSASTPQKPSAPPSGGPGSPAAIRWPAEWLRSAPS
jgi:hypothetical protein